MEQIQKYKNAYFVLLYLLVVSFGVKSQNISEVRNGTTLMRVPELRNGITELGDFLSIKGHPKSRGVDMKLKTPLNWIIEEGDRPNVVKKFTNNGNSFMIIIKDNVTFFSRQQIKLMLDDEDYVDNLVKDMGAVLIEPDVVGASVVTVDTYPAVYYKIRGNVERLGFSIPITITSWLVFYEDKIIGLQGMRVSGKESGALESLFFSIANSVVFPEQYN